MNGNGVRTAGYDGQSTTKSELGDCLKLKCRLGGSLKFQIWARGLFLDFSRFQDIWFSRFLGILAWGLFARRIEALLSDSCTGPFTGAKCEIVTPIRIRSMASSYASDEFVSFVIFR